MSLARSNRRLEVRIKPNSIRTASSFPQARAGLISSVDLVPTYRLIPGAILLTGPFVNLTVPLSSITNIEHVWYPDIVKRDWAFLKSPLVSLGNHATQEWVLMETTEGSAYAITPDDCDEFVELVRNEMRNPEGNTEG